MLPIESWKRKIVRFLVMKSYPRSYRATSIREIFASFGSNTDSNTKIAFDELIEDKIIIKVKSLDREFYMLNFIDKMDEIRYMVRTDPLDEKAGLIKPSPEETKGLKFMFQTTSERGWPNRGVYFYYVREDDPDHWIALNKTRPNVRPYRIILYSLKDQNSKISRIWQAACRVYTANGYQPFFRKKVEDEDQEACDNTRLGSKAAFDIFMYKQWLKIVSRKGRVTHYEIPSLKPKTAVETKTPDAEKQN